MKDDPITPIERIVAGPRVSGIMIDRDLGLSILADGIGMRITLFPDDARAVARRLMAVADEREATGAQPVNVLERVRVEGRA